MRPVKNWVVGCWHGYLSGARCRLAYGPVDPLPLMVLPFRHRLTQVVPEKGPLNMHRRRLLQIILCKKHYYKLLIYDDFFGAIK